MMSFLWVFIGILTSFSADFNNGGQVTAQVAWSPIFMDTKNHKDLWTISESGCACPDLPGARRSNNCACCVQNRGCQCSTNPTKCSQCGLEDSCQRFCNVSISSRQIAIKSGLSWVELKSPILDGPTHCWWRLQSAPGQRIELQIHRLINVGSFDNDTQRCQGGYIQFSEGDISSTSGQQICARNNRFFPPVVIFGDTGTATLSLRLDEKTIGSQLLAYISFSSADDPAVADPSTGGVHHSACDWAFDNCWGQKCVMTSPGYPGLFPPHKRCRYSITANSTSTIRLHFHFLSLPLCSSHLIAIWKRNISLGLSNLGPPWRTLCQESGTTIDIPAGDDAGGALVEFRSGATSSPFLYSGFRASIIFIQNDGKKLKEREKEILIIQSTPSPPYRPNFFQEELEKQQSNQKNQNKNQPTLPIPTSSASSDHKQHNSRQQHGSKDKSQNKFSQSQGTALVETNEEPYGTPPMRNEIHHESGNIFSIPCGMSFEGDFTRGRIFRLVIPKNLALPPSPSSNSNSNLNLNSRSSDRYKRYGVYTNGDLEPKIRPPQLPFKCQIEFQGKDTDIVQLAIFNYKFRGDNCSTRLEVFDMKERTSNKTDRLLGDLCGPSGHELRTFTSSHSKMALTILIYPEEEPSIATEFLEGAFRFHDEAIEGTVKPMSASSCEVVYYGVTSAHKGTISGPPDSPLLRLSNYPLVCAHSFIPSPNQSISLTLRRAGHEKPNLVSPRSKAYCRSFCGNSGCQCEAKHTPLNQIDHLLVVAGSTPIGCLCGYLPDALPISFESHTGLTLVYHATTRGGKEFSYSAAFHFKTKVTCANFSIEPPHGSKRWREIIGNGGLSTNKSAHHYAYFNCIWQIFIPNRYQLQIDFVSEEDEKDCNTWNMTLWSRQNDQISRRRGGQGEDEDFLLSSFCPNNGKREIKIPDTVQHAYIKLVGITMRSPQFEIRWKFIDIMLGSGIVTEKKVANDANPSVKTPNNLRIYLLQVLLLLLVLCFETIFISY